MSVRRFDPATKAEPVLRALRSDGVAIVEELFAREQVDQALGELDRRCARRPMAAPSCDGGGSLGLDSPVARSDTYREMLLDPLVDDLTWAILGASCHGWQLAASSVEVARGNGRSQTLFRDEDQYEHFLPRGIGAPTYMVGFMIALGDLTRSNGAARYVLGSHRWALERRPSASDTHCPKLQKGSVVVWLGSTLRGLGVDANEPGRTGLVSLCTVDWLRHRESAGLSVPYELASTYPRRIQQMLGWGDRPLASACR